MNRSTSANTFVIRCCVGALLSPAAAAAAPEPDGPADELDPAPDAAAPADARSFSFPRPVAELKAFMKGLTSFPGVVLEPDVEEPAVALPDEEDAELPGPDADPKRASLESCAVAGWKLVRGL